MRYWTSFLARFSTRTCWLNFPEKLCGKKRKLFKKSSKYPGFFRNCALRGNQLYVEWSGSEVSGKLSWVFSFSCLICVFFLLKINQLSWSPTLVKLKASSLEVHQNRFGRSDYSLPDSNVKSSGTVKLSGLNSSFLSSGLLHVICWSSTDHFNFPTPLVLKRNVAVVLT